jgi:hypothetical protein
MRYGTSQPGFMSLILRKQGAVDLFVIAGRDTKTAKKCPPGDSDCLTEETNAFGVVYSERIAFVKPPATDSTEHREAAAANRR